MASPRNVVVRLLTPQRLRLYPRTLLVAMAIGWVTSLAMGKGMTDVSRTAVGADFMAFYTGGRFFLSGRMDALYDLPSQKAFQDAVLAPVATEKVSLFVNPPFTVVLYAPFSWLGYLPGLLLWWAFGLGALVATAALLRRELEGLAKISTGRLVFISFLFFPTTTWIAYGQIASLTLLLYAATVVALRRGSDLWAGVALGLLLYKPQLALGLGAALLIKGRWRALAGGLVGASVWIGIGLIIDASSMRRYLGISSGLLEFLRASGYNTWGLHSFYGFAILLLDGVWPKTGPYALAALLTLAGLGGVALLWRRTPWQPRSARWDLAMAATIALGLLVSPHLYLYDLMLLLLPFALAWNRYPSGTGDRPLDAGPLLTWSALLYVTCFLSSNICRAELWLSAALGLPAMALQLSVFCIVGWSWAAARAGARAAECAP